MVGLLPARPRHCVLGSSLTHRRLSYPLQSCVPAEHCYVSLSDVHLNAAPILNQTIELSAPCLPKSRGFGAEPPKDKGRKKFNILPLDFLLDGRSPLVYLATLQRRETACLPPRIMSPSAHDSGLSRGEMHGLASYATRSFGSTHCWLALAESSSSA